MEDVNVGIQTLGAHLHNLFRTDLSVQLVQFTIYLSLKS